MKLRNNSSNPIMITINGKGTTIGPNETVVLFDEDIEKSPGILSLIGSGKLVRVTDEEPYEQATGIDVDASEHGRGLVKVSSTDTSFDYLLNKVVAGDNVTISKQTGTGGIEKVAIAAAGNISGTGTTGTIAKFSGASTIADSVISDDGTNVGIGTTSPNSKLHVAGSIALPIVTKTANYTATAGDHTILGDATSGAITITLPSAAGIAGRVYVVKKIDNSTNAVTVAASGSETIDGATSVSLSTQWGSVRVQSDGSNWFKI